jgi:predicted DNA-binding transcriptional regulator YafY
MFTEASIPLLVDAIVTRKLVDLTYMDAKGEVTTRVGEPYELNEQGFFWMWDVQKDGIRKFRVDRIQDFTVLDETFSPRFPGKVNGTEYPV